MKYINLTCEFYVAGIDSITNKSTTNFTPPEIDAERMHRFSAYLEV